MPPNLPPLVARTREAYRECRLCAHACGVDRLAADPPAGAFCRLGEPAWVYKELLSLGEETSVSPTWLIDLGGCSLRCLFCTEWRHVTDPRAAPAVPLDPEWFRTRHALRRTQGARTVSFVGGDPTVSLLGVLRALERVPEAERLPVVWNANGVASDLAREILQDVVDFWLIDAKFGNPACAERLSGRHGFDADAEAWRTLAWAAALPARETGSPRVIVRHLVMPGHVDCCTVPALERLGRLQASPDGARIAVNLMTVYLPSGPAASRLPAAPELARMARADEVRRAIDYAREHLQEWGLDGAV